MDSGKHLILAGSSDASDTIRSLALGVAYRFTVVAVNTAGRGLPGESGTVTVPAPVATPPTAPPPGKPTQELT